MQNTGIHHVSVMSSSAEKAYDFYHRILGMKLILNTVNQDDHTMIHLFFGDEEGRGGSEFTVFDMGEHFKKNQFGTNALERTYFLVESAQSLIYWQERLDQFGVCHYGIEEFNHSQQLRFEDEDGQKLGFVYREGLDRSLLKPYVAQDIPAQHAILGLGQVDVRVRYPEATDRWLEDHFDFVKLEVSNRDDKEIWIYQHQPSVFGHQIHVIIDKTSPVQRLGVGGIHHLALGVQTRHDLEDLVDYLADHNKTNSGIVYREFFHSVYFRDPNYLLFEVATPLDKSRETFPQQGLDYKDLALDLPEFLEDKRQEIQANLLRK